MHTKCTSKNQTTRLSSLLYSWALLVIILITAAQTPSAQAETLRLATTTSAASSGILDHLFTAFTKDSGIKVEFEAVGSGRAIRLGRDGSVDALITHAPAAEIDFIKSGDGVKRIPFMTNEYIIIGPSSDPANIQGSSTAALAFKKIAVSQSAFISRGDDSGTHKKELLVWKDADISPYGLWYRELGRSIVPTIKFANQNQAYSFVDNATWASLRPDMSLKMMVSGDPALFNVYSIITINPKKHPNIQYESATALADWLIAQRTQHLISDFQINGTSLFKPYADP